jgi:hypothetical protein
LLHYSKPQSHEEWDNDGSTVFASEEEKLTITGDQTTPVGRIKDRLGSTHPQPTSYLPD